MKFIALHGVAKSYNAGDTKALVDINLEIDRGELLFVVGSVASGKSTLLRILAREILADVGDVVVNGQDISYIPRFDLKKYTNFVSLLDEVTVRVRSETVFEHIAARLRSAGAPRVKIARIIPEVAELVGIQKLLNRKTSTLSQGERRLADIAASFANRPKVLLADDPFRGLDPATSDSVMLLLERLNRVDTTIVIATASNQIVDAVRRRVVNLRRGKIVGDSLRSTYPYSEFSYMATDSGK